MKKSLVTLAAVATLATAFAPVASAAPHASVTLTNAAGIGTDIASSVKGYQTYPVAPYYFFLSYTFGPTPGSSVTVKLGTAKDANLQYVISNWRARVILHNQTTGVNRVAVLYPGNTQVTFTGLDSNHMYDIRSQSDTSTAYAIYSESYYDYWR